MLSCRRKHCSFSWPWHPMQITSVCIKIYLSIVTLGLVVWAFDSTAATVVLHVVNAFSAMKKQGTVQIFGLLIGALFAWTFIITNSDPADESVRDILRCVQLNGEQITKRLCRQNPLRPGFDRTQHEHVIESNHYCNICQHTVCVVVAVATSSHAM